MRVLLIDDNEDITMISFYFESQDIECRVVNEGKQGLQVIRHEGEQYEIIFLDMAMPDFSGYDIFYTLKNEGLLQSRNIIIFTASSINDNKIQQMLSDGAKGLLRKPLSVEELMKIVERFRR
jgi:CheY-like chemotaxis protein